MKRREARDLIYKAVGDILAGTDFHFKKGAEGYLRAIPRGRQVIGVPFYDYHPRFEFSLVMTIRLDDAEDITWTFCGVAPEDRSHTETVAIRLEYFAPDFADRFTVFAENDIQNAAAALAPILRERIVPFLDAHQDVRSLDRAWHYSTKQLSASFHPYRGMHSITVAKLAGNPDFDVLVERYLAEMALIPASDRRKFLRLVEYLRSSGEENAEATKFGLQ